MRFHVIGLGPIGSLLSAHLRRVIPKTYPITLIHKTRLQATAAQSQGKSIQAETNGVVTTASGFRHEVFEEISDKYSPLSSKFENTIDSLFVTTKAQNTVPVIRQLLPRLSHHSTIVLLQNGMGIYEELVDQFFQDPARRPHFILTTNTHGAFLKTKCGVVHSGVGAIDFAIVPDSAGRDFEASFKVPNPEERRPRIANITSPQDREFLRYKSLRDTVAALTLLRPLNTSWKPMSEVHLAMQRKIVVNAVINPLTALMGCRNGDIFTSPVAEQICHEVCQEAADAYARQTNTRTRGDSSVPAELLIESLHAEVHRVAEITKDNFSSMLSDVQKGRNTEIDYINGYLVKLGSAHHVNMRANAMLANLIKMRSEIPLDQMM